MPELESKSEFGARVWSLGQSLGQSADPEFGIWESLSESLKSEFGVWVSV